MYQVQDLLAELKASVEALIGSDDLVADLTGGLDEISSDVAKLPGVPEAERPESLDDIGEKVGALREIARVYFHARLIRSSFEMQELKAALLPLPEAESALLEAFDSVRGKLRL